MKKEIRDSNQEKKRRIKELEEKITKLRGANEQLVAQGQQLQQRLAQNNTEILKAQGGIDELRKMVN